MRKPGILAFVRSLVRSSFVRSFNYFAGANLAETNNGWLPAVGKQIGTKEDVVNTHSSSVFPAALKRSGFGALGGVMASAPPASALDPST